MNRKLACSLRVLALALLLGSALSCKQPEAPKAVPDILLHVDGETLGLNDCCLYKTTKVGSFWDVSFTVENKGSAALTLTGSRVSLAGSSTFSVAKLPAEIVDSGENSSFIIRFTPADTAQQLATVALTSNDPDENPFTFEVTGTGSVVSGSVQINADAVYTNATSVTVSLNPDDQGSIQQMMISNQADFAGGSWEGFAASRGWTLGTGDGTKTVFVKFRDASGNESPPFYDSIILDTAAPAAPGTPDLLAADDSGSSNSDDLTKNTSNLTFTGTAEATGTVTLYRATSVPLGSEPVSAAGTWSVDVSLDAGEHQISAKVVDQAGNASLVSSSLKVTVDLTTPAAPGLPNLGDADDSGSSATDNITKNTVNLTFTGTAEANGRVSLYRATSVSLGSGPVSAAGAWSVDVSLPAGVHQVTAKAADAAGNESPAASSVLQVTVDTTPPASPSAPDLAAADDSGLSNTDNNTKNTSNLTFTGTAEANAAVTLYRASTVALGSTTASGAGAWSAEASLATGVHLVTAKQKDVAGNESESGTALQVTVDTTPPGAPAFRTPFNGTNTGKNLRPTFSWAQVVDGWDFEFQADDQSDFTSPEVSVNTHGSTSYTPPANLAVSTSVPVGRRYYLRVHALDIAGNTSAWSASPAKYYVNVGRLDHDYNGDGYSDVLVGYPSISTGHGYVFLYFGGSVMNNVAGLTFGGYESFGNSVADAGDVNGDGFCDALVGSPGTDCAYLYYGGALMDTTLDKTFAGVTGENLGFSVCSAGDVNADGYGDLIVGANLRAASTGVAYIYYGAANMDTTSDLTLVGATTRNYFGQSVSAAGDANDDGYADVLVGAPGYASDTGQAYLYYGGAPMNGTVDLTFNGESSSDKFGWSVASAGDTNADGFCDIIVGAPFYGYSQGRAYVYDGGAAMNNTPDATFAAPSSSNYYLGYSVSRAGDVDADGREDILIGLPLTSPSGRADLLRRPSSWLFGEILSGPAEADAKTFGDSVCAAGDVNGDGYADAVVGGLSNYYYSYYCFVYLGGPLPFNTTADVALSGRKVR